MSEGLRDYYETVRDAERDRIVAWLEEQGLTRPWSDETIVFVRSLAQDIRAGAHRR